MLHEMRVEGDGARWWDDVGMVVVVVGLGIRKCERAEGLRACQHSCASRRTLLPPLPMLLLLAALQLLPSPLLARVYAPIC